MFIQIKRGLQLIVQLPQKKTFSSTHTTLIICKI